jgi:hypothetical protein
VYYLREGQRTQAAQVLSLAVMCLALDLFILRDPVPARIGGMVGPAAVMAAWVLTRTWRSRRVLARAAALAGMAVTVWSLSAAADWAGEFREGRVSWARVVSHYQAVATPAGETMPYGPWFGMVTYLRECTRPGDRVYASWFVPELYFYAQRGFAAGMSVTFGGHWSEPRYQHRMVEILSAQSVPIVLLHAASYEDVQNAYPLFTRYLEDHYRAAGDTDFGDSEAGPGAYRVLTRRDRAPSGVHAATSMPCFR